MAPVGGEDSAVPPVIGMDVAVEDEPTTNSALLPGLAQLRPSTSTCAGSAPPAETVMALAPNAVTCAPPYADALIHRPVPVPPGNLTAERRNEGRNWSAKSLLTSCVMLNET